MTWANGCITYAEVTACDAWLQRLVFDATSSWAVKHESQRPAWIWWSSPGSNRPQVACKAPSPPLAWSPEFIERRRPTP